MTLCESQTRPLLTNLCISAAPGAHIFQVQKIVRSRTTTRIWVTPFFRQCTTVCTYSGAEFVQGLEWTDSQAQQIRVMFRLEKQSMIGNSHLIKRELRKH